MLAVVRHRWLVGALVAAGCLARVPFVGRPAAPDEGGLLYLASQWGPGPSLYGHYWVDRPPVLVTLFELASLAGGVVPLRILGLLAGALAVVLAAVLTRVATAGLADEHTRAQRVLPVLAAAVFLASPLFGTTEVDGELLATPFVLTGLIAVVIAACAPSGRVGSRWAVLAGISAVAAVATKQNAVDVVVVGLVVVLQLARHHDRSCAARLLLGGVLGAGVTALALVAYAAVRGTGPVALADAVVTFRFEAANVIHRSASSATGGRAWRLAGALALSAAPLVAVAAGSVATAPLSPVPQAPRVLDLRWSATALLAWELVAVAAGGSYWLHYLVGLVPGLVALLVAAAQRPPRRSRTLVRSIVPAVVSAAVAVAVAVAHPTSYAADAEVTAYMEAHGGPHASAVVAFGHPDILWDTGLRDPYPELWSLPVRVHDPRLRILTSVLRRHPPTWVVTAGATLSTWGVDDRSAERVLESRYRPAATLGPWEVWRRDRPPTAVPTATAAPAVAHPATTSTT